MGNFTLFRIFLSLCLLPFSPSAAAEPPPTADSSGNSGTDPTRDAIAMVPGQTVLVKKIIPADCRLVRGFTHAPVDGRTDTRGATGTLAEWSGFQGVPAVNYRIFNGNNGLHIFLPASRIDALLIRGDWEGLLYADTDTLVKPGPEVPVFCRIRSRNGVFRKRFGPGVTARKMSFSMKKIMDFL